MEQGGVGLRYHLTGMYVKRWYFAGLRNALLPMLYARGLELIDDMLYLGPCSTIYPKLVQKAGIYVEAVKRALAYTLFQMSEDDIPSTASVETLRLRDTGRIIKSDEIKHIEPSKMSYALITQS